MPSQFEKGIHVSHVGQLSVGWPSYACGLFAYIFTVFGGNYFYIYAFRILLGSVSST